MTATAKELEICMPFVFEILDEATRKASGLDASNWVVDRDRDMFLYPRPKHWQLRANGDASEDFALHFGGDEYIFSIIPAENFRIGNKGKHHEYVWERIVGSSPESLHDRGQAEVLRVLKDALSTYGGGAYFNSRHPSFSVTFKF